MLSLDPRTVGKAKHCEVPTRISGEMDTGETWGPVGQSVWMKQWAPGRDPAHACAHTCTNMQTEIIWKFKN